MTKETVGYVRLEWTCPNCGSKNPGPQKICVGCGGPQPDNVEFEQAAKEELITEEAEIARAKAGPDVHCAYCGARNPAGSKVCTQCGADVSEGTARASGRVIGTHRTGPVKEIPCPSCGAPNPETAHKCSQCGASMAQPKAAPPPQAVPAKRRGFGLIGGVIVTAVILLAILFCVLSRRTEDVIGTVETVSWTRSIAIEQLGPVTHEDWRADLPSDAVVGTCTQKVHHTQSDPAPNSQKVCGTPYTVDKGSGYGEVVQDCEFQVYEDWCSYTVKEWQQADKATLDGSDLNPRWPALQLRADQREGEREESYAVVFDTDGKTYTYKTSDATKFAQCQIGSRWILKVNTFNAVTAIEPVK